MSFPIGTRRIKILFLSHSADWFGAEHCLFRLLKGINPRKYEAVVVLPGHGRLEERIHELGVRSRLLDVGWWVKMTGSSERGQFQDGLERRVGALAEVIREERPDLVFTNTAVVIEGALAARLCGVPHVWHLHELIGVNPDLVPLLSPAAFFSLADLLTDRFVAVSQSVERQVRSFIQSDKIEVIYNGLDAFVGRPRRQEILGLEENTPVVSFVGTLSNAKGVLSLVDAAPLVLQRFPEVKFALAGADGSAGELLERRLREEPAGRAFRPLGFRKDATDVIASSDVLVLPSLADSMPLVVLEAMLAGKPVVATRSGGAAEMVLDGETGFLVPVDDPPALARAVVALLEDPERMAAMGRRGKERAQTVFSHERFIQKFEQVFDHLASETHRAGSLDTRQVSVFIRMLDSIAADKRGLDEGPEGALERAKLVRLREDLMALLPPGVVLILVDEDCYRDQLTADFPVLPFLERDGQYWGAPSDDDTAIRELERLRRSGASFLAFASPAFWWLDCYRGFRSHLRSQFQCLLENERLILFDLRGEGGATLPPASAEETGSASDLTRPPAAATWERVCLTAVSPVQGLSSPAAQALAGLTVPGDVLLEAGCGSGTLSAELATADRVIELCDFSQAILDRAAELFRVSGLPTPGLTLCDLTQPLPWPDRALDVVWSSGVLEHWTDEELLPIVSEMARISRKGVISLVPYAGCVFYRLGKHLAEVSGRWPYGREIPRRSLKPVFERAGLSGVREWTVWNEWGPRMLGLTDAALERQVCEWWDSLSPDDPAREGQGYLLLTVGFRSC
jgi:glycosyltransferase involved in cell wall biosynthesis/SAM-dependent methyltransferase